MNLSFRRRWINRCGIGLSMAAMAFGLLALTWIMWTLLSNGLSALSVALFVQDTPAPGSAGGLRNAIVGSLLIVGVSTLVATPVGILAGI
ncbi:MAG TPA: phosphate ABC transporter permease PtsA, partial [Accumulibacter sp.]|nr:phosphate ABC transporter permease PtsA [Accumulibacter sp.]